MAGQRGPNILVIMADEHAAWASGAYGHPFIQMPNMDALAGRGVTFDAAYCNSPLCAPSRAAFMTGRLAHSVGAWNNGLVLSSDLPTWAHYLSAAGYQTVLTGKQHFVGPDQRHGFELRLGGEVHSTRTRPWSYVTAPGGPVLSHYIKAEPGRNRWIEHDYEMTEHATGFLRGEGRDASRPFALCVSLFAPHFPFQVEEQYWQRYWPALADLPEVPEGYVDRLHPAWRAQYDLYRVADLDETQIRRARAAYYGLCSFLDDQIGRLLGALEVSGHAEDTLIVYTTDHGEHLGQHGLWLKKTFFEESVRVPLIVAGPGLPRGERRGQVVSLVDLAAALVEWGGGAVPSDFDGRSLAGVARDTKQPWVDLAISEHIGTDELMLLPEVQIAGQPRRMIRLGRYKLNYFQDAAPELYDLEADPGEWRDLAADPAYASVVRTLTALATADWDPESVTKQAQASMRRAHAIMEAETAYLGQVPMAMT